MNDSLLKLAIALGCALLSMLVYLASGRRMDADATRKGSQLALGLGNFLLHWFFWVIAPLEKPLVRGRVAPLTLNLAGLAFGVISGVLIAFGRLGWGGIAILLGGVCDVLDGRIARARNITSRFGAFIDSTLDRYVEVFAFLGFLFYLHHMAAGPFWAAAAMAGSLIVSYARARGESLGVLCKGGLMQRAERMSLMVGACFVDGPLTQAMGLVEGTIVFWALVLIAVGTFATSAYRTVWIAARLGKA
ncbi:MAG: CDP-alcohol phosphatidyltransferase family protein [Vicinamibacteria bacterium]|nr:CDP-alcohol phosphatidyltransferase family protein [Vicinamibacteria bacterium]